MKQIKSRLFSHSTTAMPEAVFLTDQQILQEQRRWTGSWEATDKDLSGFRFTITGGDEATNAAITAGTVVLPQSVNGNF